MDKNYFFTPIYTFFLVEALLVLIKKNKKEYLMLLEMIEFQNINF